MSGLLGDTGLGHPPSDVTQAAYAADDSSDGLVFGEVEDEVFSTPLAVTRASSRAAETPSTAEGTFLSPHSSSPPEHAATPKANSTAALAAAALQEQFPQTAVLEHGSSSSILTGNAGAAQESAETSGSQQAQESAAEGTTAPVLEPAAGKAAAEAEAEAAAATAVQPAGAAHASEPGAPDQPMLSSLAELSFNSNGSSSRDQAGPSIPPESPSSPSAVSSTSSEPDMPAAAHVDDSADTSTATASAYADRSQLVPTPSPTPPPAAAAAAAAGAATSSTQAVAAAAAAGSPRVDGGSSVRLSPPCSPVKTLSSGGLDRAQSWQLQHAAAAAAGTAAHPAPPRSDMDLAKLSNTPASPHGEAGWAAWQQRRRHFFVLTAAGKPVYSRHGDEQALAGFMAVIQALLSVMSDQGDVIHSITVGTSSIEFLLRGQLYLVAVSSRGEAQLALRRQLELLYQSILMVATGGIERLLTRSPGYDVQQLLAGAKPSMNALVSGYGDCPGWMMASVEPAPTAAADRQLVTAALQEAVKACDCLYGVLLVAGRVVAVERGAAAPALNVFDLLLLINFSCSNESLRHNETFVPVCLPNFQPNAFVHAYVNCLEDHHHHHQQQQQQQQGAPSIPQQQQQQPPDVQQLQQVQQQQGSNSSVSGGTFLLLLSGSADAFHKLSAAQHSFVTAVTSGPGGGVLGRVQAAAVQPGRGRVRVEALPAPLGGSVGSTPLWHAVIRYPQRHQHITLAYPQQLFAARSQVKQLVRSYCRLYCSAYGQLLEANAMATAAGPFGSGSSSATSSGGASSSSSSQSHAATAAAAGKAHKLLWVTSQRWVTGVLIDRDVEIYATFDPLTEKDVGLKMAETLKRLFGDKARRQDLLIAGL